MQEETGQPRCQGERLPGSAKIEYGLAVAREEEIGRPFSAAKLRHKLAALSIAYALRPDQFQTLCDGEMSVSRSLRDACIGAFLTGVVGIVGIVLTIDWG